MSETLGTLRKKRAPFRAAVVVARGKLVGLLESDQPDVSVLEIQVAELQRKLDRLTLADTDVLAAIDPGKDEDAYGKEVEEQDSIMDGAAGLIIKANKVIQREKSEGSDSGSNTGSAASERSTGERKSDLPKIPLPTFSGNIQEWRGFYNVFYARVLGRSDIPDVLKLIHLLGSLDGAAKECFQCVELEERNLDVVVRGLKEKYGDPTTLLALHVRALHSLPRAPEDASPGRLRDLLEEFERHVREVRAIAVQLSSADEPAMRPSQSPSPFAPVMRSGAQSSRSPVSSAPAVSVSPRAASGTDAGAVDPPVVVPSSSHEWMELFIAPLLLQLFPDSLNVEWQRRTPGVLERYSYLKLYSFLKNELDIRNNIAASSTCKMEKQKKHHDRERPVATVSFAAAGGGSLSQPMKQNGKCRICLGSWHRLAQCESFLKQPADKRKELIMNAKMCLACLSSKHFAKEGRCKVRCSKCSQRHNTLLHDESRGVPVSSDQLQGDEGGGRQRSSPAPVVSRTAAAVVSTGTSVVLQTVKCRLCHGGRFILGRALLDPGSETSYVVEDFAVRLGMPVVREAPFRTTVFGGGVVSVSRRLVSCTLASLDGVEAASAQLWTSSMITCPLTPVSVPAGVLAGIGPLAEDYDEPNRPVQVLIGSDLYWTFVKGVVNKLSNTLVVMDSLLGRFLSGRVSEASCYPVGTDEHSKNGCYFIREEEVRASWSLEALGVKSEECDKVDFLPPRYCPDEGRLCVALPWKNECRPSSNLPSALRRLENMSKGLSSDQVVEYGEYIKDMMAKGFIRRLPSVESGYYLPHRGVWRAGKLRVVFDGNASSKEGSINTLLHTGPNLLPNLVVVVSHFRLYEVGLQTDIRSAFLTLKIEEEDSQYVRFLWWENSVSRSDPVAFEFRRLCFGLNASPCLLNTALHCVLEVNKRVHPETTARLRSSIYVDDCLPSVPDVASARLLQRETTEILGSVGMELKEWVIRSGPIEGVRSALGVQWHTWEDILTVKRPTHELKVTTRRELLSAVSSFFDPLGILSPWLVRGRRLIQQAWEPRGWDDSLSPELLVEAEKWLLEMEETAFPAVPRWVCFDGDRSEIHVFVDASTIACAACVYLVTPRVRSTLLIARQRLAPRKPHLSVPRLELMAALIGARLYSLLCRVPEIKDLPAFFWTDSEVTRFWIRKGPAALKIFESNRVKEVLEKTTAEWRRVPTDLNPADLGTRGTTLAAVSVSLWLSGPSFLMEGRSGWPDTSGPTVSEEAARALRALLTTSAPPWEPQVEAMPFQSYQSLLKTKRVLALVMLFVDRLRKRMEASPIEQRCLITKSYLKRAHDFMLRLAQQDEFGDDYRRLQSGSKVLQSSRLSMLRPYFDIDRGLIMIRPRNVSMTQPKPLLPTKSRLFQQVVQDCHERLLHGGPTATLTEVLQSYHVVRGKSGVKRVLRRTCYNCRRVNGGPFRVREAFLPDFRCTPSAPFSHTGMDFVGPLSCRGRKYYILLFTCAVVRALHLEVTESMGEADTERAVRRFAARRGRPLVIYCDNALSFIKLRVRMEETELRLIPPRAPWFGGFYERLVGCVKRSLRATLLNTNLDPDELRTVVTEVEEALNRRPLVQYKDYPLTPLHFLSINAPSPIVWEGNARNAALGAEVSPDPSNGKMLTSMWKRSLHYSEACWRRFRREYLPTLRQWRTKDGDGECRRPRVGELVLVEGAPLPRLRWSLARVLKVDQHRAEILMNGRVAVRAIRCLYPLEASDDVAGLVVPVDMPVEVPPGTDVQIGPVRMSVGEKKSVDSVDEPPLPRVTRAGRVVRIPRRLED